MCCCHIYADNAFCHFPSIDNVEALVITKNYHQVSIVESLIGSAIDIIIFSFEGSLMYIANDFKALPSSLSITGRLSLSLISKPRIFLALLTAISLSTD